MCSKGLFPGLIFGGAYFRRGLLLDGILRFKPRVELDYINVLKLEDNSLKPLKTANPSSPWA